MSDNQYVIDNQRGLREKYGANLIAVQNRQVVASHPTFDGLMKILDKTCNSDDVLVGTIDYLTEPQQIIEMPGIHDVSDEAA